MRKKHFPKSASPSSCLICYENILPGKVPEHSCIEPEKLRCEQCLKPFKTLYAFNKHLKVDHKVMCGQYKCDVCRRAFGARILLDEHSKVHVNSTFTCDICSKLFPSKVSLQYHMNSSHNEKGKISSFLFLKRVDNRILV